MRAARTVPLAVLVVAACAPLAPRTEPRPPLDTAPVETAPDESPAPVETPAPVEAAAPVASVQRPAIVRAPTAIPSGLRDLGNSTYENVRDGSILVWIPPGRFTMGSDVGGRSERPAHPVTLTYGFFMGAREVTSAQFLRFCTAAPHAVRDHPARAATNYPVSHVNLADARAYCAWAGLHLPLEVEWERAAKGEDDAPYPWGSAPPDATRLNLRDRSCPWLNDMPKEPWNDGWWGPAPVGSFPRGRTPFGCDDMAGNVREWVDDNLGRYAAGPTQDPVGPRDLKRAVVRGGAFDDPRDECTTSARWLGLEATTRSGDIGLRVAYSFRDLAGERALAPATADEGD